MLFAPYKAILAEALAPTWAGTEEEKAVLREGLGLTPPGEDFWAPLGEATKFLHPEDRVRLLVDFTKAFKGGEERRQALLEVKDVLEPVCAVFGVVVGYLLLEPDHEGNSYIWSMCVPPSGVFVLLVPSRCTLVVSTTIGGIVEVSRTRPFPMLESFLVFPNV